MAIPKIIYQTARNLDALTPEERKNTEAIKALNPGWEYRFYSDEEILRYIGRFCRPRFLKACKRINPHYGVVLADLFRYIAVYREGGVYLDAKSSMTRPLDEVLSPSDSYLIGQWANGPGEKYENWGKHPAIVRIVGGEFQQWYVIAEPNHPYLGRVITEVLFNMENYNESWFGTGKRGVLRVSGPICYSLSIAPILALHRHRFVDIEKLGFVYSIFGTMMSLKEAANHYSRCKEPVMLPR